MGWCSPARQVPGIRRPVLVVLGILPDGKKKDYPKAVACLAGDMDALLIHYHFKTEKWRKAARSTNAIERCFVEVRRRTRPMGVMADRASMNRIL